MLMMEAFLPKASSVEGRGISSLFRALDKWIIVASLSEMWLIGYDSLKSLLFDFRLI